MGEKAREKKRKVCVGFMGLEKAYDKVNMNVIWQVLRMYDVDGKLLNGIKIMYVNSLACFRVKEGESEWFRSIALRDRGVLCPLGFSLYI